MALEMGYWDVAATLLPHVPPQNALNWALTEARRLHDASSFLCYNDSNDDDEHDDEMSLCCCPCPYHHYTRDVIPFLLQQYQANKLSLQSILHAPNEQGLSPWQLLGPFVSVAKLFWQASGCDETSLLPPPSLQQQPNGTILHAWIRHPDTLEWLTTVLPSDSPMWSRLLVTHNAQGDVPLVAACRQEMHDAVDLFLAHGAHPSQVWQHEEENLEKRPPISLDMHYRLVHYSVGCGILLGGEGGLPKR